MNYIYRHFRTQDTTGYYACVPEQPPSFQAGAALLESRPLDTFLHRYLLQELLKLDQEAAKALASNCGPALACLLHEGSQLAGWDKSALPAAPYPWHVHTPLPLLAGQPDQGAAYFRANIHGHKPLPEQTPFEERALAALRRQMAQRQGRLRKIHADMASQRRQPEAIADPKATYQKASQALRMLGAGPEQRHEASLCPIALLREWQVASGATGISHTYQFSGRSTAYGRGLTLAQARVSCAMEIIERASAFAHVQAGGSFGRIGDKELVAASYNELAGAGKPAIAPDSIGCRVPAADIRLYWLEAESVSGPVMVPAQAAYLFLNLDEPALFEAIGSTGLGAGATDSQAKLAALLEVIERDAHATTPFCADACFELSSSDPLIQGLLADYRWRGIFPQFQEITTELGVPAYRCFVRGLDGSIAQASAAALSGPAAALAALTETPWPYSWATLGASPSSRGLPGLEQRQLESLPNYELPGFSASLELLEKALAEMGLRAVYVNLTRPEFALPVWRAFIPGLETDPELDGGPSARLAARIKR